jgi:hypothetical protein
MALTMIRWGYTSGGGFAYGNGMHVVHTKALRPFPSILLVHCTIVQSIGTTGESLNECEYHRP